MISNIFNANFEISYLIGMNAMNSLLLYLYHRVENYFWAEKQMNPWRFP